MVSTGDCHLHGLVGSWALRKPAERLHTLLLLDIGGNIDQGGRPLRAILHGKLLEQDLCGLAIGRVLGEQVEARSVLDLVWGRRDVEVLFRSHVAYLVLMSW